MNAREIREYEFHLIMMRMVAENLVNLGAYKNSQKLLEAVNFFENKLEETIEAEND